MKNALLWGFGLTCLVGLFLPVLADLTARDALAIWGGALTGIAMVPMFSHE